MLPADLYMKGDPPVPTWGNLGATALCCCMFQRITMVAKMGVVVVSLPDAAELDAC
jgi:hypothetical protein